ncbi:MAG: glycogen/starch/alpha-glucan family phosphorylase [Lachnospiraceae bacterium]|nr:glycogen/starch/alpha-glucan family phosphorylase [Lachnospiraceae bacterium]
MNMEKQLIELSHERFGKPLEKCGDEETYFILMLLIKRILKISEKNSGEKKVYYVSAEFLPGRFLLNTLINLGIYRKAEKLLARYGRKLQNVLEYEPEPSLGSGGLGRLSACFMDSIATLGYPAEGIGINYRYGLFRQSFSDHMQQMDKDPWIQWDSWEDLTEVSFDVNLGKYKVRARMYEISVAGYHSGVNKLKLFDLESADGSIVHDGIEFDKSAIDKNLTLFVYPDDSDEAGKILRLYQQYFLVSCAAQQILSEMKARKCDLRRMYDYAVIQINDTHPSLIIPELIRILTDDKALSFMEAVKVVTKTCAYTNHTILTEALETWSVDQLSEVVPQLVPIIHRLDLIIKNRYHDPSVWIIDSERRVHMANLCVHFGFSVNGVAKIHTKILEQSQLRGFYQIYPEKFSNKTNGISFRRWLYGCNSELSDWISAKIGNDFKLDPAHLEDLRAFAGDSEALHELEEIKARAKARLSSFIKIREGVDLIPDGIYDLQIKRIHEYKRQQMNALYVIHKYLEIKRGNVLKRPVNFIFGGKAASAYVLAQDIIHLILVLCDVINSDPDANQYMRMVMVTDYNVTYAERLIPAADISEQISLASREASGTGNMKLMLNGALTLGTNDGANVELCESVGEENIYLFGISAEEVISHYERGDYDPSLIYNSNGKVREAVDFILSPQMLAKGRRENLERLYNEIRFADRYMALLDLESYIEVKDRMMRDYEDRMSWNKKALLNIAGAAYFSSDRTIAEYNRDIWKLKSFKTYSEEGK